jgi:pimeloyl-ACP methyl ester carboxylesterase
MAYKIEHHEVVANGIALHYVVAGRGIPLLLIHGFPQTWRQWCPLIERLAERFRIIAPDLPGIGMGPAPATGYDKHSFAEDIRELVRIECAYEPMLVCGHNMGAYVAFAYALKYTERVDGLILVDTPPPGTTIWDEGVDTARASGITFHADVETALARLEGHERSYIEHFILSRAGNPTAISSEEMDHYADAYSAPGALRASFEMFRALAEDSELNRRALARGKLDMAVTLVGAADRMTSSELQQTADEIAVDGRVELIDDCGHWIAQEQPDALAAIIRRMAGIDR